MKEKQKMLSGELYDPEDPSLKNERLVCKDLCFQANNTLPSDLTSIGSFFAKIFHIESFDGFITTPFWCDYGYNIKFGKGFYVNHNCVILDAAPVTFGDNVLIGPDCGFYTSSHPLDAKSRASNLESAHAITVGNDVWFGGGVRVLPGITIGDDVVIGSGSVVTKDIPSHSVAAGNPCKVIRQN